MGLLLDHEHHGPIGAAGLRDDGLAGAVRHSRLQQLAHARDTIIAEARQQLDEKDVVRLAPAALHRDV